MKKNNKKGVSLVALVATIFIMLIIAGTVTVSFSNIYNSTRKKEFANEIYSIQKLVDQYYFRNNEYPVKEGTTTTVSINGANLSLSEIDLYELGANETNRGQRKEGNNDDVYLVSEETGKVYYKKGWKIGDNTYYNLTDELKKELGL